MEIWTSKVKIGNPVFSSNGEPIAFIPFVYFFDTCHVFPQGSMGVRGPQGPRGPTGPRVSDASQDLQMITFDFIFHKGRSMI